MQQPVQPYYTISASFLLRNAGNPELSGDENIRLNILLDIQPSQIHGLLSLLNTTGREFLFSLPVNISADTTILKALLPACYLLASMDLYAAGDAPVVPVLGEQPGEALQTGLLQDYFAEQGIAAPAIPVFHYSGTGVQEAQSCSFVVYNTITPPDAFEPIHLLPVIIAVSPAPADLITWNQLAAQLQPCIITDTDAILSFERKRYETEMTRWENRALLYRHFLQLSKQVQEQEYYEVIDWYNHEYEILPLWYKRFGHIIKVFMGKRSFRSLFSDNVKKYKD